MKLAVAPILLAAGLLHAAAPEHPCLEAGDSAGVYYESSTAEWSWSPDGVLIAHDRAVGDRSQIRIVERATGRVRCITAGHHDSQPSWSPDGKSIAFVRRVGGTPGIHLLDLESGEIRALTSGARAEHPAFSPDGQRLAYVRFVEKDDRGRRAVVRSLDADKEIVVFDSPFGLNNLGWNPDGSRVLLYSIDDDGWNDLFEAKPDGSGARRVTDNTVTDSYSADYRYDSKLMLFGQGSEDSPYHRWFNYDLYETEVESGATRRLTWTFATDDRGRYSPDGTTIGFTSRRSGYAEIWLMRADGSGLHPLTWQPDVELSGVVRRKGVAVARSRFNELREKNAAAEPFGESAVQVLVHQLIAKRAAEDAVAVGLMGVETHPDSWRCRSAFGLALLAVGRNASAHAELKRSLAILPDQVQLPFALGSVEFLKLLDSIDGIYADKGLDLFDLAGRLVRRGDLLTALELVHRLDAAHPENELVLGRLAYLQMMLGDTPSAIATYRRVLAIDDDHDDALFHLGRLEGDTLSGEAPAWAEVIDWKADPDVVADAGLRQRIEESGLPWHVRDRRSGVEMLLVLPGSYLRGAAADDPYDRANERPQHEVRLTRPFYLGRHEVTNAQMRRFSPEHTSGDFERDPTISLDQENHPAVNVSWEEATAFASHFGLRLPTEAEWEYAARAGVTSRYPWGNDISRGMGRGNVFNAAVKKRIPEMDWEAFSWHDGFIATSPVGYFPPNAWGFHDMFGNVWEYVADSFDDGLYATLEPPVVDPLHDVGGKRTLRGGGFGNAPRGSGIPYRYGMEPDSRHFGNGFRIARSP